MGNIKHIIFDWQGVLEQVDGFNQELFDWIRENQGKYQFSILSNCYGDLAERLKILGAGELFTAIFSGKNHQLRKPNLKAYQKVLEEIDELPEKCLFVDDSPINIQKARVFKMKTICYKNNKIFFEKVKEYE